MSEDDTLFEAAAKLADDDEVPTKVFIIYEYLTEDGPGLDWVSTDSMSIWDRIGFLNAVLDGVYKMGVVAERDE